MAVYLDHAASTPLDERAMQAMLPYFAEEFGNPSSIHRYGQRAEAAVEGARADIATIIGCDANEIIFTSGGSESDNMALKGAALASMQDRGRNRVLITPVEHPAIMNAARQLVDQFGMRLEFLPVDKHGMAAPDDLRAKIGDDVAVVSIIHANNEIGTINPIQELGEICRERSIPFHTDSVQGAAHLDLRLDQLHIDLLSLGAHKFYGPKGVGVLYIRRGTAILPSQTGGAQEFGLRAGTHNVPLIVGMAQAFKLNHEAREDLAQRDIQMRDRIIQSVLVSVQESILTGHRQHRLPNHASFVFRGVNGNDLLAALDLEGYACSSGSACKTGEPEPSLVIRSLGLPEEWVLGSLRVTVGRTNTEDQIDGFLQTLPKVIERLRVRA